jgi:hypothetical protein
VIPNENTFPSVLQQELRRALGESNLEVVNAGCPDYTTWESLINFQLRLLELSPDLAIVYHNINDVEARLVEPSSYRSDNTGLRKNWSFPDEEWWEASHLLRFAGRFLDLARELGLDTLIRSNTSFVPDLEISHDTRQYK